MCDGDHAPALPVHLLVLQAVYNADKQLLQLNAYRGMALDAIPIRLGLDPKD